LHLKVGTRLFLILVLGFMLCVFRVADAAAGGLRQLEQRTPLSSAGWVLAQSGTPAPDGPGGKSQAPSKESVNVKLVDLELVDQDGSKVKFKTDVIGDKVAVIIPFYTTCTTAFPILIFMFTRLQEALGDRLGKEVVLVSVSVDPRTDIPVRLKAYARRQKAKPGWVFLSGDRNNLGQVLLGVGVLFSPNLEDHNHIPITLVGSAHSEWRRFHGFPSPEQILGEINKSFPGHQGS
jgi:cytochrome oxidase Cu insertion factor (SCO1/SenC/PrrC family)